MCLKELRFQRRKSINPRERFVKTLKFEHPDRIYYSFGPPRKSTLEAWKLQGLPEMPEADDYDCPDEFYRFVGMDPNPWQLRQKQPFPVELGIYPSFEVQIIKEDDSGLTWRDEKGIVMHDAVRKLNTPGFRTRSYLSHPVTGFGDWPEMQKRFDPHSQERFPDNWDDVVRSFQGRETPLVVIVYGLFSLCRDWVGFENLCVLFYDNPKLIDEMMEHITYFYLELLEKALAEIEVDCVIISEDMAYKHAAMISPEMMRQFMLSRYKRLVQLFRKYGVPLVMVDSDGHIGQMIPIWIEAGIDGNFPCEIAADNDPLAYCRKYGKDLALWGCIDKREIRSKERTYQEVMSKVPKLVEQGGCVPSIDHAVPPDVPLRSYLYMAELIKAITEKKRIPQPEDPLPIEKQLGPIQRLWGPDLLERVE